VEFLYLFDNVRARPLPAEMAILCGGFGMDVDGASTASSLIDAIVQSLLRLSAELDQPLTCTLLAQFAGHTMGGIPVIFLAASPVAADKAGLPWSVPRTRRVC
jgi:hypothetical protein